ncbi:GntR family transcriptional regulator [Microbacter margulisiae]|uniref:DNA-binding GntR family transcriptional regulator n=1 Tax=Microbacter margulisiae TaxID=1350067 RepID=A0A7W5DPZ9_9PORP|nr:GntR family transcriptional regulator [Microbacter margulisiae]MBB3186940.1 DNA-binding GntR family transcriptional regulator [Microbacter margulisiae]
MKDLPEHKKLYETLRNLINEGIYTEGSLLPSENELAKVHSVARPTVRKALDRLVVDGFIVKHQGKGSVVKGVPQGIGILSLHSTTTAVGDNMLTTKIICKPEVRAWDKAFSFAVSDQEQKVGCIYFERLRSLNGKPVFYDVTMLPNINFPRFTSLNLENKSLFDVLRAKYQLYVTGGIQQLFAIKANVKLQEHFRVKPGHPVLQLDRRLDTNKVGVNIYSQVFCITDEIGLFGTF